MEVFGSTFDDSVFEESKDKISVALSSYNAKFCEPQWFCETVNATDELEQQKIFKFRGDLAYRQKDYQKALTEYSRCLSLVPSGNVTVKRDVLEGLARCHCHLRRRDQSLEITEKLKKEATNTGHLTCVLNLELTVYQNFGDLESEILVLLHLVSLHPYNHWNWKKLGVSYLNLFRSLASFPSASSSHQGDQLQRTGDCTNRTCLYVQRRPKEPPVEVGHTVGLQCDQRGTGRINGTEQMSETRLVEQQSELEDLWLKACVCLVRTRLLIRIMRTQQSSFVLQRSEIALQEIEEALKFLEPKEKTLQQISEVMAEDLVAEKMKEDSQDGESLAGLCQPDFYDRWYNRLKERDLLSADGPKRIVRALMKGGD